MIKTDELRGFISKRGTSQRQLAAKIGINERTFYIKMTNGVFKTDEIDKIVLELSMTRDEAIDIFFARQNT